MQHRYQIHNTDVRINKIAILLNGKNQMHQASSSLLRGDWASRSIYQALHSVVSLAWRKIVNSTVCTFV